MIYIVVSVHCNYTTYSVCDDNIYVKVVATCRIIEQNQCSKKAKRFRFGMRLCVSDVRVFVCVCERMSFILSKILFSPFFFFGLIFESPFRKIH